MNMTEKECKTCHASKPVTAYHKKPGGLFGVDSVCSACVSIAKQKRFAARKEAKERRKKSRSLLVETQSYEIKFAFVNDAGFDAAKSFALLTEAINLNLLAEWEAKAWNKKGQAKEEELPIAG